MGWSTGRQPCSRQPCSAATMQYSNHAAENIQYETYSTAIRQPHSKQPHRKARLSKCFYVQREHLRPAFKEAAFQPRSRKPPRQRLDFAPCQLVPDDRRVTSATQQKAACQHNCSSYGLTEWIWYQRLVSISVSVCVSASLSLVCFPVAPPCPDHLRAGVVP